MIRSFRLRLTIVLITVAAATCPIALASTGSSGGDTSAVAINVNDGSSVFRLAFQIRRVTGDVIDNQNAAVAYASCTECQTVAISIQVLLIAGSPTVFTPQNIAIAINEQCMLCDTMALAYQFAVGLETRLKFTSDGNRELADLRRQLEELRRSDLPIDQIHLEAAEIVKRLSTVLSTELVGVAPTEPRAPTDDANSGGSAVTTPAAPPSGAAGQTTPRAGSDSPTTAPNSSTSDSAPTTTTSPSTSAPTETTPTTTTNPTATTPTSTTTPGTETTTNSTPTTSTPATTVTTAP